LATEPDSVRVCICSGAQSVPATESIFGNSIYITAGHGAAALLARLFHVQSFVRFVPSWPKSHWPTRPTWPTRPSRKKKAFSHV